MKNIVQKIVGVFLISSNTIRVRCTTERNTKSKKSTK